MGRNESNQTNEQTKELQENDHFMVIFPVIPL